MSEEAREEIQEEVEEKQPEEVEGSEPSEQPAQEAAQDEEEEEKPKVSPGVQKRIDEITRKRYEAERRAEENERKLREYEEKFKQFEPPKQDQSKRPKLEDFDYDEEKYYDALSDWKIENRLKAEREREEQNKRQQQLAQVQQEYEVKRNQVITNGVSKYDDFEEVALNDSLGITAPMAQIMLQSDRAEDIAYYLGKNPDQVQQIAQLHPVMMAREFGRIEERLRSAPKKKTSKAPPPIDAVTARGSVDTGPSEKDDADTWRKKREAQLKERGRR